WDTPRNGEKFIEYTMNKIKETNVLVIIGYSFPFFNREIDMTILNSINLNNLNAVYIQDLYPEEVWTKFIASLKTKPNIEKVVHLKVNIENQPEFYLPPELTL